jgi:hypothetical protein
VIVGCLVPTIRLKLPIAAAVLSLAALHAAIAAASVTQEAILQDDNALKANPVETMQILRDLGVTRVRGAAVGGRVRSPARHRELLPRRLAALGPGVRLLRKGGRNALRRLVQAAGVYDGAAAGASRVKKTPVPSAAAMRSIASYGAQPAAG